MDCKPASNITTTTASTSTLAQPFRTVVGAQAQEMKELGEREYSATFEGEVSKRYTCAVPDDILRQRVRFQQGDACNLAPELVQFDAVLAANLVRRGCALVRMAHTSDQWVQIRCHLDYDCRCKNNSRV